MQISRSACKKAATSAKIFQSKKKEICAHCAVPTKNDMVDTTTAKNDAHHPEPLVYVVNLSAAPLPLFACCLEDDEDEQLVVERLMPGRCCAASRLAVYKDRLWIEVAAGYSGSQATVSESCWLRDTPDLCFIDGPEDDDDDGLSLEKRKKKIDAFYFKATSHDVSLYSEPRRTAQLMGDVGRWECVRCIERRWDATSNEMWARLDDKDDESERWVCVSERRSDDVQRGLALEPLQLTGFFLNTYARNYPSGQLPLRDAPSLGKGSTKVASLPHWVVVRALSVALVPRRGGGNSAVGTLWVEIAMAALQSCWAIQANANTGIVVLEPTTGAVAPTGTDILFRNVYSKGALQLRSRDEFLAEASGQTEASATLNNVTLGSCVGVRQLALSPNGQLWAECRLVIGNREDGEGSSPASYGWAIARSLVDGGATLERLSQDDGYLAAYRVVEDAAVRTGPRNSTVARTLPRGAALAGESRLLDDRGEIWIRTSDGFVAESAGGVTASVRRVDSPAVVVKLLPDEVRESRERSTVVPPPAPAPVVEQKHDPVADASVLASLDDFAVAATLADNSIGGEHQADALRAVVDTVGGREDDGLLVEEDDRIAKPLLVVRNNQQGGGPPHLLVRVTTSDPRALVALLVVETPEHTLTLDKPLSGTKNKKKRTVDFALYENVDYCADPVSLVIRASVAPSAEDRGKRKESAHNVFRGPLDAPRKLCCCVRLFSSRRRKMRTGAKVPHPLERIAARTTSRRRAPKYSKLPREDEEDDDDDGDVMTTELV